MSDFLESHLSEEAVLSTPDALTRRLKGQIEAALFITRRPLSIQELSEILKAPLFETEEALIALVHDYAFREDCALEINDTDGYILQVREDFADVVNTMMPADISPGALRTLSAIAIKAPILQSDLITFRGSSAYEHIHELLAKKLISKKREGRSYRLNVTRTFHEYFQLAGDKRSLEGLVARTTAESAESSEPSADFSGDDLSETASFEDDALSA